MKCNHVSPETVYNSWYRHELKTRNNANEWVRRELPYRAGFPTSWSQCEFEPFEIMNFVVSEGTGKWKEWSEPEGTFERISLRIVQRDKKIPIEDRNRIQNLSIDLANEKDIPLFNKDPIILRRNLPKKDIYVIEGHHRVSAIITAIKLNYNIESFIAYIAD